MPETLVGFALSILQNAVLRAEKGAKCKPNKSASCEVLIGEP
jgi:hypothetical protein